MEGDLFTFVRGGDPERFAAALFAPDAARGDLLALYAFNLELARIGGAVSEPMLGAIRLQWWAEAIAREREGRDADHPIASVVAQAARRHNLPFDALESLIEARQFDVTADSMPDWPAFEAYADATAGRVLALAAAILGAPRLPDAILRPAGRAQAAIGLLRAGSLPGRVAKAYLPGNADDARDYATGMLATFTQERRNLPAKAVPAFLPITVQRVALGRLGNVDPAAAVPRWRVISALALATATGRP
ncbi:MAG: hypothetical protein GC199_08925 [Alphaproteobacteria bacterium]|nr:hypothetical protein [Alphaproteobacteria bacterium]